LDTPPSYITFGSYKNALYACACMYTVLNKAEYVLNMADYEVNCLSMRESLCLDSM